MDCRVVVEAAVPVYDVETPDEAIRIAIAKTGEMLNPDLNYVEIEMGSRTAPSGEELPPAFIAADEALVALELEMLNPDLNYVEINMGERSCPHCGEELEPAFIAADESLVALELEMKVFNVEQEEHASRIARKEIGQRLENVPLSVLRIDPIETDDEAESTDEDEDEDDDLIPEFEELVDE